MAYGGCPAKRVFILSEQYITSDTSWGSHLPALAACVCATKGAVLEVGVGHWSTPFLRRLCMASGRKLVSVDEDALWAGQFADQKRSHHEVHFARYNEFLKARATEEWSVVLLDHSPGFRRAQDALLFHGRSDYIVVHDYANEIIEGFAPILERWPYREVAHFSPKTLVLGVREIPKW